YMFYAHRFETPGTTAADYCRWLAGQFEQGGDESEFRADRPNDSQTENGSRGPVFLVGFPRSGTTLLENVLASHPDITALDERDTLGDLTQQFLVNDAGLKRLAKLTPGETRELRAAYWSRVRKFNAAIEGKVVVDKYPLTSI